MKLITLLVLSLIVSVELTAQEKFNGIVVDSASFSPLPYVTIRVKNKNIGTTTDISGNFTIQATQQDTIILSLVGYNEVEQPLFGWEPSMILLPEKITMLNTITIRDTFLDNPYEGMFDDQNEKLRQLNKRLPFYYSKARKEKVKLGRLENENIRVQTYVNVVVNNPSVKENLMKKHKLTEKEYYTLLSQFNEKNYQVMYYLTAGELLTLLNNFFDRNTRTR